MLLKETPYKKIIFFSKKIITEVFKVSLITYLFLYLINDFFPGFVADFFSLDAVLWITIISGILTAFQSSENDSEAHYPKPVSKKEYLFMIFLSLTTMALIYYRIQAIGRLAYVIAFFSGIIIYILSLLLINNFQNKHEKSED